MKSEPKPHRRVVREVPVRPVAAWCHCGLFRRPIDECPTRTCKAPPPGMRTVEGVRNVRPRGEDEPFVQANIEGDGCRRIGRLGDE